MPPNEVEKFLSDTNADPTKVDVFEQPLTPDAPAPEKDAEQPASEGIAEADDDGTKPRNRRERRLMQRLEQERESSIFLAGKLAARTEAGNALNEEADYLKAVERIYGTQTPEAQLATDLLKKALSGARDDAENRAFERLTRERTEAAAAEVRATHELDSMIDDLEETYKVSLTDAQERSYFQLLEKMSPKREGVVVEYADPHAVWEVFSERLNRSRPDNRAKDLSSRSMVNSGASTDSKLNDDVYQRFLRENGII